MDYRSLEIQFIKALHMAVYYQYHYLHFLLCLIFFLQLRGLSRFLYFFTASLPNNKTLTQNMTSAHIRADEITTAFAYTVNEVKGTSSGASHSTQLSINKTIPILKRIGFWGLFSCMYYFLKLINSDS